MQLYVIFGNNSPINIRPCWGRSEKPRERGGAGCREGDGDEACRGGVRGIRKPSHAGFLSQREASELPEQVFWIVSEKRGQRRGRPRGAGRGGDPRGIGPCRRRQAAPGRRSRYHRQPGRAGLAPVSAGLLLLGSSAKEGDGRSRFDEPGGSSWEADESNDG